MVKVRQLWEVLVTLGFIADLRRAEGNKEEAVRLLTLVEQHPASLRTTRALATASLSQLANDLPAETYASAVERGKALNLDAVVAALLQLANDA